MRGANADWLGAADPAWVRRDRSGKFSRHVVAKALNEIEKTASDAFSFDMSNGYRSVTTHSKIHVPKQGFGRVADPPRLDLYGKIYAAGSDTPVGAWRRTLKTGPTGITAYHLGLDIEEGHQGKGIGSAFNAGMESYYQSIGVDKIVLHANDSVGGYAWAVAGYDWDYETTSSAGPYGDIPERITERLASWDDTAKLWGIPVDDQDEARQDLVDLKGALENGWLDPSDVAAFGHQFSWTEPIEGTDIPMWPGKDLLVGAEWNGVRNLNDPERAFEAPGESEASG